MSELGFVFHSDKCIQCHACQAACKNWRKLEHGVNWRRVQNQWQGSYPDIFISTLSVSCMHCVAPACMDVCPSGAISKRAEDGLVLVDSALCTGCRLCFEACPVGAPQFGADGLMSKCDFCSSGPHAGCCAVCVLTCPTQALEQHWMSVHQKETAEESIEEHFHATGE